MNTIVLMTLTAVGVVALFVAVAVYVYRIACTLEHIGGDPTSYLAKIAFGVRAIEAETAPLEPGIEQLNGGMVKAHEGLRHIRDHLDDVLTAVGRQGGG